MARVCIEASGPLQGNVLALGVRRLEPSRFRSSLELAAGYARPMRLVRECALAVLLASTGGCAFLGAAPAPMGFESYPRNPDGPRARCLLVFLPGFGDGAGAF